MFASDLSIFHIGAIFLNSHAFASKKGFSTFQGKNEAFFCPYAFNVLKIYIRVRFEQHPILSCSFSCRLVANSYPNSPPRRCIDPATRPLLLEICLSKVGSQWDVLTFASKGKNTTVLTKPDNVTIDCSLLSGVRLFFSYVVLKRTATAWQIAFP